MSHSPTGASGAERWMNCPGSVAAIAALPPDPPNKKGRKEPAYRAAGNQAHEVAALAFNTGRSAAELVGPRWPNFRPKDADAVQHLIDWIFLRKALLEERYDTVVLRVETPIGDPDGDFRGTVDIYLLCFEGFHAVYSEVYDYKHGTGLVVPVERNPQLMYYAHGVQRIHPRVSLFGLGIIQPRLVDYKKPEEWTITGPELQEWATNELFPAILRTKEKDAPLKAGPWCRFCLAAETCATFAEAGGKASLPPLFITKEASPETKAKWIKHLAS
jgi:hypothetical protein